MHHVIEQDPHVRLDRRAQWRPVLYWIATLVAVTELAVGGVWDIARIPIVRDVVGALGYPTYFLVLLGTWKVLGAVALVVPRRPLVKEWAYAGAFFVYTGAIASHLTTGSNLGEVPILAILLTVTVVSWALRPPSRRLSPPTTSTQGQKAQIRRPRTDQTSDAPPT